MVNIFLTPSTFEMDEIVGSSAIFRILYDEDSEELSVYFYSGSVYTYVGVKKSTAKYFIYKASSKGRYFVRRVRNSYSYYRAL